MGKKAKPRASRSAHARGGEPGVSGQRVPIREHTSSASTQPHQGDSGASDLINSVPGVGNSTTRHHQATQLEMPACDFQGQRIAARPLQPADFSSSVGISTTSTHTLTPRCAPPQHEPSTEIVPGGISSSRMLHLNALRDILDSDDGEDSGDSGESRPLTSSDNLNSPIRPGSSSLPPPGAVQTRPDAICSTDSASLTVCRWKNCKRVDKSSGGNSFLTCGRPGCEREAHAACVAAMLDLFGAGDSFNKATCGKRCYNTLVKLAKNASAPQTTGKKRVLWHNDGPSQDISSLSVLIDWITSGDNYDRYRGGEGQTGETKTALAQQIVHLISIKGIKTVRTPKDVMTKISSLESTFRAAVDWLSATGQGVTDESSLRENIIERCPEYNELFDTMHSRISTRAQLLNTDQHFRKDNTESDECSSSDESTADLNSNPRRETPDPMSKRSATIPMSIAQPQNKRPRKDDFASHPALLRLKQAQLDQHRDLQLAELDVRKKEFSLRELEFVARQKQLNNDVLLAAARIDEANAQATKLREKAEYCSQQRKIMLLRERKQLLDEGIPSDEIELLLPLRSQL